MKKLFIIVMVFLFSLPVIGQISSAKLQASGLTCAMCARAVYKNLEALPFVEKIDTDLNGSAFMLDFKDGAPVNIDAVRKKVEDAGFSVAALELTASFDDLTVKAEKHVSYQGNVFHFLGVKEQVINGEKTLRIVDKNFVTAKEQKKYQGMTLMDCYKTGIAGTCCSIEGIESSARIYHVTF